MILARKAIQKTKKPPRQKAHSWMRIYANRRIPDYRKSMRSFEVKCRYVDVAQGRVFPVGTDSVLDGTYTLIIDNIEYTLDGNNKTAVADALKIHEAFYEKEFKEGTAHTIKAEKELDKKWMYLRGISARWNPKGTNTDYVQYVKATTTKGIAEWIATALTRSWSKLNLSDMELDVPGTPTRTTIKLRSYAEEVVAHDKFDVVEDNSFSHYSSFRYSNRPYSSNFGASMIKKKAWIKKKAKKINEELQQELGPKVKAKKMITDYYKKQVA